MIKFESIVLNKNNSENKIYSFILKDKKINFVNIDNKEDLNNLISISVGFYKPYLGNLIYDDIDFLKLSIHEKNLFHKNNISYIFDFYDSQLKMSVYEYLMECLICLNIDNSFDIEKTLIDYKLNDFKNNLISELNSENKIRLLLLSASLNNPKYLFISDIEKYLVSKNNFEIFLNLLNKNFLNNAVISIFSTEKIFISNEKYDLNFIDLNKKHSKNNAFYFRDNEFKEIKNKTKIKNYFYFFKSLFLFNVVPMIFWYILSLAFFMFLFFSFSNFGDSGTLFERVNLIENTSKISIELLVIFSNLIFCYVSSHILYKRNVSKFYFWTRKGLSIYSFLLIYILFISFFFFTNVAVLVSIELIFYFKYNLVFNWIFIVVFIIVIFLFYIIFSTIICLFYNKRMFKFNEDLV